MTQPRTRARQGGGQKKPEPTTAAVLTAVPDTETAAAPTAAAVPGVPHILTAIREVMLAVRSVGKDSFNEQQRFKFRGIDDVINAVGPAMRDAGMTMIPKVISKQYDQVNIGTNRTLTGHGVIEVCYQATSLIDGSIVEIVVPGEAMDVGDKTFAKAMSVAYRIALIQCFALPTGEPDPDHSIYERSQGDDCRVPPAAPGRAERPQDRSAKAATPPPPKPTTEQLSRWEGQVWEVGPEGLHGLAVEIWNAGAWEAPVPGKEGRTMVQELVDRVACVATSDNPTPTRDQFRQLWVVSGSVGIIDMHVTSGEGTGPTLRSVLQEVGEALQRKALAEAAGTENGTAVVAEAAASWDDTLKEEARWQGET